MFIALQIHGAKIAARTRISTMTVQTTNILSCSRRLTAMRPADLPVRPLAGGASLLLTISSISPRASADTPPPVLDKPRLSATSRPNLRDEFQRDSKPL